MKIRIPQLPLPAARSKVWRFAQGFLLIGGLLALALAAFSYVARYGYQAYESWQFDRSLAAHAAAPRPPAELPIPTAAFESLIGRIAIPRLGISAMVKEGVDYGTLDLAVGHIPSTALPGQPGNVAVAAHRDSLFRNLKDVRRGDEITLTTLDNAYVYRVISFQVVGPTEISVLAPSAGKKTLTLVTCYPFYFVGHAPKRFVVRALQVETAPYPESAARRNSQQHCPPQVRARNDV